jgi:hypothetical protein
VERRPAAPAGASGPALAITSSLLRDSASPKTGRNLLPSTILHARRLISAKDAPHPFSAIYMPGAQS